MKRRKVNIFLAVSMLLVLFGCNLIGYETAMVGTWESSLLGVTTTYVFSGDRSVLGTVAILEVGITTTGAWSADGTVLSISWEGSSEAVVDYYSYNDDKSQMTLLPVGGGLARTFIRQ